MKNLFLLLICVVVMSSCSGVRQLSRLELGAPADESFSMNGLSKFSYSMSLDYNNPTDPIIINSADMDIYIADTKVGIAKLKNSLLFESGESQVSVDISINIMLSSIVSISELIGQKSSELDDIFISGELDYGVGKRHSSKIRFKRIPAKRLLKDFR